MFDKGSRLIIDQLQQWFQSIGSSELRLGRQPRQPVHNHLLVSRWGALFDRTAQQGSTALKLGWKGGPVQVSGLELLLGPAFDRAEFFLRTVGEAQIELPAASAGFDEHHKQTVSTGYQADRFKG